MVPIVRAGNKKRSSVTDSFRKVKKRAYDDCVVVETCFEDRQVKKKQRSNDKRGIVNCKKAAEKPMRLSVSSLKLNPIGLFFLDVGPIGIDNNVSSLSLSLLCST